MTTALAASTTTRGFFEVATSITNPVRQARRVLLDTNSGHDARLCGYDGPRSPSDDGEGCIITDDGHPVPSLEIASGWGTATLHGVAELRAVRDALNAALAMRGLV